jgi:NADPH:quinone reductase-like Zn-dependent oxidoreductase
LRPAGALEGKRVLVFGASGSMGTAGVQLAKHFGAHVTAVCGTPNVELVRSLGADEVIDYLQEDFTKNGETYDAIFDAVGLHSFRRCKRSLAPGGVYLPTDGMLNVAWWLLHKRVGDKKVLFELPPRMRKEDVLFLKGLIESGEYQAVIDRDYPLEDIVEAYRYVDTKQKAGNVVLTVA